MKIVIKPKYEEWEALCERPVSLLEDVLGGVKETFSAVNENGDAALKELTKKFDGVAIDQLACDVKKCNPKINSELKRSIKAAYKNINKFHKAQTTQLLKVVTSDGVVCWQRSVAIEKVGIYIPGGTAPLFSTLLMLAIPAQIAGCKEIVVCTPPDSDGSINPIILYVAKLCGIKHIYKVGGAQAIAAMTFGTESVPAVNKIFGPGNQYVTAAKQFASIKGVAIDMPAGPSEVLIIADKNANPRYIAADLLSQAEHGKDSQVILLSNSKKLMELVLNELNDQLEILPRKNIAEVAINNSRFIQFKSLNECIDFSNQYAPEHLIINCNKAESLINKVKNAGSVFIGKYSCESAGDYASGTNHTLPTNGYAKAYSGVSVDSFQKKISFQKLNKKGIRNIGPSIMNMAKAEGLEAHSKAVEVRLNDL